MMEIAVIGSDDFVTGFALAGVRNVYVAEEGLDEKVEQVAAQPDIGVLVMHQQQFDVLNNKTKRMIEKMVKPILILISENRESDIKNMIKRSLGVDLWK